MYVKFVARGTYTCMRLQSHMKFHSVCFETVERCTSWNTAAAVSSVTVVGQNLEQASSISWWSGVAYRALSSMDGVAILNKVKLYSI